MELLPYLRELNDNLADCTLGRFSWEQQFSSVILQEVKECKFKPSILVRLTDQKMCRMFIIALSIILFPTYYM